MKENGNSQTPHRDQGQGGSRPVVTSTRDQVFFSFLSHLQNKIQTLEDERDELKSSLATAQETLRTTKRIISEAYQSHMKERIEAFGLAITDSFHDALEIGVRHQNTITASFEDLQSKLAELSGRMEEAVSSSPGTATTLQTEIERILASHTDENGHHASDRLTIRLEKLGKGIDSVAKKIEGIRDEMVERMAAIKEETLSGQRSRPSRSGTSTVTGGGSSEQQQAKDDEERGQDVVERNEGAGADDEETERRVPEGVNVGEQEAGTSVPPGSGSGSGGPRIKRKRRSC